MYIFCFWLRMLD